MNILSFYKWYKNVIKSNFDFDYGDILEYEFVKYKRMIKWWDTNDYGHSDDGRIIVRDLKWMVCLLDMMLNNTHFGITEDIPVKIIFERRVNFRNAKRFLKWDADCENETIRLMLYESKAWNLYCKIREYRMRHWWD